MRNKLISYLLILAGGILSAAAIGLFVLPQNFVAGGVTGLALLLSSVAELPVSWIVLSLNLFLFFLGWIFVGKEFVWKTLIMSFLFPLFLEFFGRITIFKELSADPLMSSLLAGCMLGVGSGLILQANGSSGGFDILGVILNKKFHISVSVVMYVCDFCIILWQSLTQPLLSTAYVILVILCCSIVINKIMTHGESKVQILIFSQKYKDICYKLLNIYDTGATLLNAETGYEKKSSQVILTILPYNKVSIVKKMVYDIDPYAFTIMNGVNYVGGRGYSIQR